MKITKENIKDLELVLGLAISSEYLDDSNDKTCDRVEKLIEALKQVKNNDLLLSVSNSFNSEEELLQFIYMHTPIAVKTKSKLAKGKLVSAFKTDNAFEQVCKHLAKKLFNVC